MLGYDDWLLNDDHLSDWSGMTCDKCGVDIYCDDMHDDEYYDTPAGRLCWECAYDLAYDLVKEEYPQDDIEDHEEDIEEYLDDWRA